MYCALGTNFGADVGALSPEPWAGAKARGSFEAFGSESLASWRRNLGVQDQDW